MLLLSMYCLLLSMFSVTSRRTCIVHSLLGLCINIHNVCMCAFRNAVSTGRSHLQTTRRTTRQNVHIDHVHNSRAGDIIVSVTPESCDLQSTMTSGSASAASLIRRWTGFCRRFSLTACELSVYADDRTRDVLINKLEMFRGCLVRIYCCHISASNVGLLTKLFAVLYSHLAVLWYISGLRLWFAKFGICFDSAVCLYVLGIRMRFNLRGIFVHLYSQLSFVFFCA